MLNILCLSALVCNARAQHLFDMGLKGGIGQDDLSTSYAHSPLFGGHAGVFARVTPPLLPGVQGELLVSTIGTSLQVEDMSLDLRAVAVQVPLFLVLAFGPVEVHAGGHYARYLDHPAIGAGNFTIDGHSVSAGDLNKEGIGLLGGVGFRLGHFYAGARYLHALHDMGTGPILSGVRSRQLQAYIGVGFFKAPK